MTDLFALFLRSATAFTATNLDDIVILLLFFSQVGGAFRPRHIVIGQYLGFAALVLISLSGFFGSFFFPRPWMGLLGVVPIVIGFSQLLLEEKDNSAAEPVPYCAPLLTWLSPQATSVAAITIANGGDNVGIYMPLFANTSGLDLAITLTVFFTMVGLWCYGAYRLARVEKMATLLTQYGRYLVPFVLVGLGLLILLDSHTLEYRGLTALAIAILGVCLFHLLRLAARLSQELPSLELPAVEKIRG